MENRLAATIRSVGKPAFYPKLAEYLRFVIDHDNIIAMICRGAAQPVVQFKGSRGPDVFRRLEKDYLSAAYNLDPFMHLHRSNGAGGIFRLLDIAPDNFSRSKYYQWYYGDLGITDEITVFCRIDQEITATVTVGRAGGKEKTFSAKAEKQLRQHEPVLMALLEAHWADVFPDTLVPSQELPLADRLIDSMIESHGVKLSKRQSQVAILILQGHSSESAALKLGISPQTIKVFRKQLYKRSNISSQAELFLLMMPLLEKIGKLRM